MVKLKFSNLDNKKLGRKKFMKQQFSNLFSRETQKSSMESKHIHTQICIHTYVHTHVYTHIYTCICSHPHIYTHIYIYIGRWIYRGIDRNTDRFIIKYIFLYIGKQEKLFKVIETNCRRICTSMLIAICNIEIVSYYVFAPQIFITSIIEVVLCQDKNACWASQ